MSQHNRLISAEQVVVKGDFTKLLLELSKLVIKDNPRDIYKYSRKYFEEKLKATGYFIDHTDKLEVEANRLIYRLGEDIKEFYEIGERVGGGDAKKARAYKAKHLITGETKAVKIVYKGGIKTTKRDFIKSVELNVSIDHPGILTHSEVYEDKYNFYMVGDLMHGELWDYLSRAKKFTESDAAYITQQLL